jgi:hypothetical protein
MRGIERKERSCSFVFLVHERFANHLDGIINRTPPGYSVVHGEFLPNV